MKKAILHIDGDSFFASCEVSLNPRLKGLPVVTGQERGIASAMSKEAKALGVFRGMPVFKIRKLYPEVIILSSDYGIYETFAKRMFAIVRRYADIVEEYSIDECFAEIDSWDKEIVDKIKKELQSELGMTFSLGLAETKVLAKITSSKNKPDGLTILFPDKVEDFLRDLDIGKVWGIGPATSRELREKGIKTALDLYNQTEEWILRNIDKHTKEIWYELRGKKIFNVTTKRRIPKSIQATRTFTPVSSDKSLVLSELSKNVENACANMRIKNMSTKKVYYYLKTSEFRYHRQEIILIRPTSSPAEILNFINKSFDSVFKKGFKYRSTGVTLSSLVNKSLVQEDLFGEVKESSKWDSILNAVDKIDKKFGSHTVTLTSSLKAFQRRGGAIEKRLNIPYMGEIN